MVGRGWRVEVDCGAKGRRRRVRMVDDRKGARLTVDADNLTHVCDRQLREGGREG